MKGCIAAVLVALLPACFAGRAFPVASDRYTENLFKRVNSYIEKDPTNFVVDLSGRYATCDRVGERGAIVIDRKTPDGATIGGLVDYTQGSGTNAAIVATYIKRIFEDWPGRSDFSAQIRRAEKFGCSVQPGCKGYAVVACLFSPEYSSEPTPNPIQSVAQAFTPEQYIVAEDYLGMAWDRSHFLENLSGLDAECGMIDKSEWKFKKADEEAKKWKTRVSGLFGNAPNNDNTEAGMRQIISRWKKISFRKMGCSVIPDCKTTGGGMQVVVSCLYTDV